jgi:exonuclease III
MDIANVCFWNVRGLNSRACRDVVAELEALEWVSLLCLQETKLEESDELLVTPCVFNLHDYVDHVFKRP